MSVPDDSDKLLRTILKFTESLSSAQNAQLDGILRDIRFNAPALLALKEMWIQVRHMDMDAFWTEKGQMPLEIFIRGKIIPALRPTSEGWRYVLRETEEEWVIKTLYKKRTSYVYMRISKASELCLKPGARNAIASIRDPNVLTLFYE